MKARLLGMGLLARWIAALKKGLDRRVTGPEGEAHVRFEGLVDRADLVLRARVTGGRSGALALQLRGAEGKEARAGGAGLLEYNLGPGKALHGCKLQLEAQAEDDGQSGLVVLSVELLEPRGEQPEILQTYSVEGRLGPMRQARLTMLIDLD